MIAGVKLRRVRLGRLGRFYSHNPANKTDFHLEKPLTPISARRYMELMYQCHMAQNDMAAANGNLQREQTAVKLNSLSRAPPAELRLGQSVHYHLKHSSASKARKTGGRNAAFIHEWPMGTVVKCTHPVYLVETPTGKVRRHSSRLRPAVTTTTTATSN